MATYLWLLVPLTGEERLALAVAYALVVAIVIVCITI